MEIVEAGADESTLELFDLIEENIRRYEQEHHPVSHSSLEDVLRFLIEQSTA